MTYNGNYYEELLNKADPEAVARELLGDRITGETGNELLVDCPHHDSQSKTSLHINRYHGLWHCFACDVGGNLIHLVEWFQTEQMSKGPGSGQNAPHREARDWLADCIGFPRLSSMHLSKEELQQMERTNEIRLAQQAVLGHLVKICNKALPANLDALQEFTDQYGFTTETIEQFSIGWMPVGLDPIINCLIDAGHSQENLVSSGAFLSTKLGEITSKFRGRVIFPVVQNGEVVDFFARRTQWTPESPKNPSKYDRLAGSHSGHGSKKRTPMFGEDALRAKSKHIILAEGVPDAIAATQAGFPAVAIGTNPGAANLKFIAERLGKTKTAVFVPDQEISQVGIRAALKSAKVITGLGCSCKIAQIPIGRPQADAISRLNKALGTDLVRDLHGASNVEWDEAIKRTYPNKPGAAAACKSIRDQTKIDLCDWLHKDADSRAFEDLVRTAPDYLLVAILFVKEISNHFEMEDALDDVINQVAGLSATKRGRCIEALATIPGQSKTSINAAIKEAQKEQRKSAKEAQRHQQDIKLSEANSGPKSFPLTDSGNAERLVHHHQSEILFCSDWDKWLFWDEQRWRLDREGHVALLTKKVARQIIKDGIKVSDTNDIDELYRFAQQSESAKRRRDMRTLASHEKCIQVRSDQLDKKPLHLNVLNGTIDLTTGKLHPHSRNDRITKLAEVVYDPKAKAPEWMKFLETIQPIAENLEALQRAAGYSLTGDVSEQVLFFCLGTGANGKSTYLNAKQRILGRDYAIQAAPDLLLSKPVQAHPTGLSDLAGIRMAACTELSSGRGFDESLVKQLTGGDSIRTRRMNEDFWEFCPTHHIWVAANHKPESKSPDQAFWRRFQIFKFDVSIPLKERDPKLLDRIMKEASGVLNWLVQGCLAWQRDGLGAPAEVQETTDAYRQEVNFLGRFLAAKTMATGDEHSSVGAKELYQAFQDWRVGKDIPSWTQKAFGGALKAAGIPSKKSNGRMVYMGISLLDREDQGPFSTTHALSKNKKLIRKNESEDVVVQKNTCMAVGSEKSSLIIPESNEDISETTADQEDER